MSHEPRAAEFRLLADMVPQLVWTVRADGGVDWCNRRWYEYTGMSAEAPLGWGWCVAVEQSFRGRVLDVWRHSIETGTLFDMEFPLLGVDGTARMFLTRVMPLRDDAGNVLRWFGTSTDVDGQRRSQAEREQLLESERAARMQAERASRLKDEFLATLSHELRTPLNAILGWVHLLKRNPAAEQVQRGLDVIGRNARAQADLINDLLDMSRIIAGKLRVEQSPVALAQLADAAIDAARPLADERQIRLARSFSTDGLVLGDASRLQQAVANLLNNALKFTPREGRIAVELADGRRGRVVLSVTDSGCGIAREFLPHVFERFRQADASMARQQKGLGLGLAIVKSIVELHGGEVAVDSPGEGAGATFALELPGLATARAGLGRADPLERTGEHVDLQGLPILAVDDDPDVRDVVTRLLQEAGGEVVSAGSAIEALDVLANGFEPRVIVSDLGMPQIDGFEFLRRLRERDTRTPVIALTAYARVDDRARSLAAGFRAHLSKPVNPVELAATVAAVAREAALREQR